MSLYVLVGGAKVNFTNVKRFISSAPIELKMKVNKALLVILGEEGRIHPICKQG